MKKFITYLYLCITVVCLLMVVSACSKSEDSDLSFGGIMIGRQFPDNLIKDNHFKYKNDDLPNYSGLLSISLPDSVQANPFVTAWIDQDSHEVCNITITGFNRSELTAMFDMLRAKYGEPYLPYGKSETYFPWIVDESISKARQLGMKDQYGIYHVDIAEWKPAGHNSTIKLFTYTLEDKLIDWSQIELIYNNREMELEAIEKCNRIRNTREAHKKWQDRETYKQKNKKIMEQDF